MPTLSLAPTPGRLHPLLGEPRRGPVVRPGRTPTIGPVRRAFALLGLILFGAVSSSRAETLVVPTQFPTIQSALNAPIAVDTVLVLPGLYVENLIMRDGITLISQAGPVTTRIDGGANGRVLRCESLEDATIRGFTIQNGLAEVGAGAYFSECSVVFEGNIVRDNTTFGTSYGGGVYTTLCPPSMIVRNNVILSNWAHIGGGVCCNGEDRSTIIGNTIWGNAANFASGIISYNGSDIRIANNIIAENDGGKGLYVHSSSEATIECNDVWKNTPENYHNDDLTGIDGNISVDPKFCDSADEDLRLQFSSPCLPGNHPDGADCGTMGALEAGCGVEPSDGACCFEVDECVLTTASICEVGGGTHLPGVLCSPNPCPPTGACCLDSGECIETGIPVCEQAGGTLDIGGACDPNPCYVPFGACCLADGSCLPLAGTDCVDLDGVFLGDTVPCEPGACDAAEVVDSQDSRRLELGLPQPNPSWGEVAIPFTLSYPSNVRLEVVEPSGRRIALLVDDYLPAGAHRITWTAPDPLGAAVLILVLRTPQQEVSRKLIHLE